MVKQSRRQKRSPLVLLAERLMALLVLANLGLVVFDLTYIKARNWYLKADLYLQERTLSPQEQYVQKVAHSRSRIRGESGNRRHRPATPAACCRNAC